MEKARTLITSFRQFIEGNKDQIQAIQVLYSRPYRAGLRYRQVKELAAAIQRPPLSASPLRLWQAYQTVEPDGVKGSGGKQWLVAIRDHIANSLSIDQDDFGYAPFSQFGGLGKAYGLFGDRLPELLDELDARLAA